MLLLLFSSVSVLADSLVEMLMREMPSSCCSLIIIGAAEMQIR